ncbi:MAG: hypothetical protein ABSA44_09855 [Bacteroidota bacterium]|jgi:hypothetical protein
MKIFKQVGEVIPLAINFKNILDSMPGTQTITDGDVSVLNANKKDGNILTLVNKTIGTTRIDSTLSGGTKGNIYIVVFTAITQNYRLREDVLVEII